MRHRVLRRKASSLCILLSTSAAGCSLAIGWQSVAAQDAPEFSLEEVVVTAQKRSEGVQDTPIAIAAFTGEQLRERQVDGVARLAEQVPNVQLYDLAGGGVPVVVIRGIGLRNSRINDTPTTAVYVDEVYQTSIAQLQSSLFDLQRVEVLKGPQGGLYGRNAIGGAIQYLSARPNVDSVEGYAEARYGRYDMVALEGAVGGPLSETLAVRLAGQVERSSDTYFRSVPGGYDHGEADGWAARVGVQWRPSDTFDLYLKLHGGEDQSELPLTHVVAAFEPSGPSPIPGRSLASLRGVYCSSVLTGAPPEPNRCTTVAGQTPASLGVVSRYDSASLGRPELNMEWGGAAMSARWSVGGVELTSITAWDELDYGRTTDLDSIPTVQLHIDYRTEIEILSQSLRAAFSPLQALDVLVGVDASEDTLRENTDLAATDGLLPFAFRTTRFQQPYEQTTRSWAAFTRLDFSLSSAVSVAGEARYTQDDKRFTGGVYLPEFGSFVSPRTGETLFIDDDKTFSAWTGKLILQYEPTEDLMLYASLARGFKTGGFFGGTVTTTAQLEPYDNEFIDALEIGTKTEWLDHRLRVNLAAFYYEREDIQANGSRLEESGVSLDRLTNIGDGETIGVEAEILVAPTPQFLAGFAAGYADTEIVESDFVVQSIFGGAPSSPVGARLPNQPEFSANGFVRQELQFRSGHRVFLRADYTWQSDMDLDLAVTVTEEAFLREDSYGLLDLSCRFESSEGAWSAAVFVNNVAEEKYRVVARDITSGGLYEIWGAPRTWGVSLSRRW